MILLVDVPPVVVAARLGHHLAIPDDAHIVPLPPEERLANVIDPLRLVDRCPEKVLVAGEVLVE